VPLPFPAVASDSKHSTPEAGKPVLVQIAIGMAEVRSCDPRRCTSAASLAPAIG